MVTEQLKVILTGEATGIKEASAQATDALEEVGSAANDTGKALDKVDAGNVSKELDKLSDAADDAGKSIKDIKRPAIEAGVALDGLGDTDLNKITPQVTKVAESFKGNLTPAVIGSGKALDSINPGRATTALSNLQRPTVDASHALNNLSRVAQDAPFGFMAISNNLNPLLEGFQRLSVQSKEAGTSLKSVLISSLSGPGGLGLALGVASAAITFMTNGFGPWIRGFMGGKDAADENKEALVRFKAELDATKVSLDNFTRGIEFANRIGKLNINVRFGKGLQSDLMDLQGQSVQMRTLYKRLDDDRRAAFAKMQAAEGRVANLIDTKAAKEEIDAAKSSYDAALNQYNDFQRKYEEAGQDQTALYRTIEQTKIDIQEEANKKAEEQGKKALENLKKRLQEEADARTRMLKELRTKTIQTQGVVDIAFPEDPLKGIKFDRTSLQPIEVPLRINIAPEVSGFDIDKLLADLKLAERVKAFNEKLTASFRQAMTDSAVALGEGIGDAFSGVGDGLGNAFKRVVGIMGNFIKAIGKQLIEAGVIMLAFKAAFEGLFQNPLVAIAVGTLTVAIGQAIANTSVPKLAKGGLIPGGYPNDTYPALLSSGERVVNPKQWDYMMNMQQAAPVVVVQRLRGRDLVLQQARETKSQRRGG